VATAVSVVGMTVGPSPASADDIEERLREVLGDEVSAFEIVELDVGALAASLEEGKATLPVATAKGELVDVTLAARPAQLREEGVTTGMVRTERGVDRVPLPAEQAYRLGDCPDGDACATATILDDAATMVSGLVVTADHEVSYYEPVNQLLETDDYPGLHVVYSDANTLDLAIDDETAMRDREPEIDPKDPDDPGTGFDEPRYVERATRIVLDGDRTFFTANPATVWNRQLAIFNDFTLLYEVIEPLSFENPETVRWRLDLTVKGQEVWASGGPSTTDSDDLVDELTAPGYWLLNPVTDDEIHLFFVGYDVAGVFGQAAGIGTASGGIGGSAGNNHVFVEARASQTAKTKWVVSAHEVGHLIGGTHGAGSANSCSNLWLIFVIVPICGVSIMAPGSAGAPDGRAAYFTDANDANIGAVLEAALP
jgi:hypothetical protein